MAMATAQLLLLHISTCFLLPSSLHANDPAVAVAAVDLPRFSFSFNFSDVDSYSARSYDLRFQGTASPPEGNPGVDLTCNKRENEISSCSGRMSYNHSVVLHDGATTASFSTRFTFAIRASGDGSGTGDGIAFFLSGFPLADMLPRSAGGYLGLVSSNETTAYGARQFLAVEFDTYKNGWDPSPSHIGVDVNSVLSWNTMDLPMLTNNGTITATIQFNGTTGMLVTSLQFNDRPSTAPFVFAQVIPDLKSFLPREVAVGFSASTGIATELHQILAWSFNSTLAAPTPHKDIKKAMIITGGALALVLLMLVPWFILSCWKWTSRHHGYEKQGKLGPTLFEYRELDAATGGFSNESKLGEGFFAEVYRGYIKKLESEVAVKMIKNNSYGVMESNKDFYCELNTITSVRHRNLVKLVGWCMGNSFNFVEFMCWCWKKEDKLFLVYELMPNRSLFDHLHKTETLPWETRYKIVKDITRALLYLHHECDPFILHRDIKPGNILLDNNFNAKLADFGLSRIVDPDSSRVLTYAVGTEGYLDPLCRKRNERVEFSRSSDVYSFGIVLLDIACKKGMVREQVWQQYTNRSLMRAADDKLQGEFHRSEMENVIILGLWCSYPDDSKKRPTMEQVMAVLEHGKPLPDLNSLDTTSASSLQETYIRPQTPSSAGSSSYGHQHA